MKLARVRFRNFRCYQQETAFGIDDLTLFAGRNDAGTSAIFDLNIFFEEAKINADDGSMTGDKKDIRIVCEFDDLPEEIDARLLPVSERTQHLFGKDSA